MKKILLALALALSAVALRADYAQELPDFGKSRAAVRTLTEVVAVAVVEGPSQRGVIARYKSIYSGMSPKTMSYAGRREENVNGQLIFITGLDHRIITDRCFLFHRYAGATHLLFVWAAGTETVEFGGRKLRLRRYTTDPSSKDIMTQ